MFKRVKVKICGLTRAADALAAVEAGADAIGFIFVPGSRRQMKPMEVRQVVENLPPFVSVGGVFADQDLKSISEIRNFCELDFVQLHGRETPLYCQQLGGHIIKALHLPLSEADLDPSLPTLNGTPLGRDRQAVAGILEDYPVSAFLLDTYTKGKSGGTGQTFNWKAALWLRGLDKKIIVSGGLRPANVAEAVAVWQPYAVDTSSGVELKPGQKDPELIEEFIRAVHQANDATGANPSCQDEVLGDACRP